MNTRRHAHAIIGTLNAPYEKADEWMELSGNGFGELNRLLGCNREYMARHWH